MAFQTRFELKVTRWDRDGTKGIPKTFVKTIALTERWSQTFAMIADADEIIWDPINNSNENITGFDYCFIETDQQIEVQFTIKEGDANEELELWTLPAGGWLLRMDDASYYNHSASDANGGTAGNVEQIKITCGSIAATVHVELGI